MNLIHTYFIQLFYYKDYYYLLFNIILLCLLFLLNIFVDFIYLYI